MSYTSDSGYTYEGLNDQELERIYQARLKQLEENLFTVELELQEMKSALNVADTEAMISDVEAEIKNLSTRAKYLRSRIDGLTKAFSPAVQEPPSRS